MQFKLRKATKPDLNLIWEIEQDIVSRISGHFESIDQVDKYYFDYSTQVFLILSPNDVMGLVAFKQMSEQVELSSLLIKKQYQNKGLGKAVLAQVLSKFSKQQMFLFTHPENVGSLITYMKSGFVIHEWIKNKYGDGEPRLKLVKSLN